MLNRFLDFIRPPAFEDEDVTLRAQLLNILILTLLVVAPLLLVVNYLTQTLQPFVLLNLILILMLALWMRRLMRQGRVYLASVLWLVLSLAIVTYRPIQLGTIPSSGIGVFLINIVVAGLLLDQRAIWLVTAYNGLAVTALRGAQSAGWLSSTPVVTGLSGWFTEIALFVGMAMLMSVSAQVMNQIIAKARGELAERRNTEQTLRQRDAIMEAATFAARKFLQSSDWRAEMETVLEQLGMATHSSHVFIFENHILVDGTEVTSQRYEWAAPGMQPDINNPIYQNVRLLTPSTENWHKIMFSGEAFYGTRDILPPREKKIYEEQGLLSFINVPIFVGERWWGVMGFDDYVTKREWTAVEIDAVKITASTLGAAIQRQINDEALRRGDAILQAVNYAAQQFFQVEDWRDSIQTVLERIGRATQSSHAYIFEKHTLSNGKPVISQRYEWVADGIPPDIDDPHFQNIEISDGHSDPWFEALARGEARYGNTNTFPPEEAEFFKKRGVKALIDAPIMIANQWWGVIGFDDCHVMRDWAVAEIDAIRIAASTLGAAIRRQMADETLRQSDLRHRTELEQRVVERTRQLEDALREIEGVSYTASHDLRAPVRAINGYANILLREFEEGLNEVERDYLQKIDRESQRMGNLLDDLIRLIQLNRQPMRITQVNLSEYFSKTARDLKRKTPKRTVKLVIQADISARGDREMIQIIANELLENAWKFTTKRSDPCIEFGEIEQEGKRVFFVRDNGIGFDMQYVHKLFRNFEQLHLPGMYEGTGMGLAIVQRIIQRHGGKVWVEGIPGEGATFYFTLPE
jgi:signal transduction histidine kinase